MNQRKSYCKSTELATRLPTVHFYFPLKNLMHFQSMSGSQELFLAIMVGFIKVNFMTRFHPISISNYQMALESILENIQDMLNSIFTTTQDRLQVENGDKYLLTIVTNTE